MLPNYLREFCKYFVTDPGGDAAVLMGRHVSRTCSLRHSKREGSSIHYTEDVGDDAGDIKSYWPDSRGVAWGNALVFYYWVFSGSFLRLSQETAAVLFKNSLQSFP